MISILWRVQNRILHNQLEALHIRLAEKERSIAGLSSQRTDSHGEDDLHSVISYLRRSKEIVSIIISGVPFPYSVYTTCGSYSLCWLFQAETEISLLKQEKSRLQIEVCYANTCVHLSLSKMHLKLRHIMDNEQCCLTCLIQCVMLIMVVPRLFCKLCVGAVNIISHCCCFCTSYMLFCCASCCHPVGVMLTQPTLLAIICSTWLIYVNILLAYRNWWPLFLNQL